MILASEAKKILPKPLTCQAGSHRWISELSGNVNAAYLRHANFPQDNI